MAYLCCQSTALSVLDPCPPCTLARVSAPRALNLTPAPLGAMADDDERTRREEQRLTRHTFGAIGGASRFSGQRPPPPSYQPPALQAKPAAPAPALHHASLGVSSPNLHRPPSVERTKPPAPQAPVPVDHTPKPPSTSTPPSQPYPQVSSTSTVNLSLPTPSSSSTTPQHSPRSNAKPAAVETQVRVRVALRSSLIRRG